MKRPRSVYLKIWPDAAGRDAALHFEPVGYGDDMRGHTSRITEYIRADLVVAKPKKKRVKHA